MLDAAGSSRQWSARGHSRVHGAAQIQSATRAGPQGSRNRIREMLGAGARSSGSRKPCSGWIGRGDVHNIECLGSGPLASRLARRPSIQGYTLMECIYSNHQLRCAATNGLDQTAAAITKSKRDPVLYSLPGYRFFFFAFLAVFPGVPFDSAACPEGMGPRSGPMRLTTVSTIS